ncbi:MAG: hypothetical protein MZV64_19500 [Ignavibacteriales bacterium]|nr:hypothetical protein [Ignavibacteriales bacterium]
MLNKAILTRDAPLADVLFGVDNTFLSRALEAEIFEPYHLARAREHPRRLHTRPIQPRPARGLRRRLHQLRQGIFCRKLLCLFRKRLKT